MSFQASAFQNSAFQTGRWFGAASKHHKTGYEVEAEMIAQRERYRIENAEKQRIAELELKRKQEELSEIASQIAQESVSAQEKARLSQDIAILTEQARIAREMVKAVILAESLRRAEIERQNREMVNIMLMFIMEI